MKTEILGGLSPILYHLTTIWPASNILEKNRFELKPAEGTGIENDISEGKYYLSCARSKANDYFRRNAGTSSVILVLDGVKLGQRYAGLPVNYWYSPTSPGLTKDNDEMEDRVLSSKPFIPDAMSYITQIHVMRDREGDVKTYGPRIYSIYRAAKFSKIPIFMYGFADEAGKTEKPDYFSDASNYEKRMREWYDSRPSKLALKAFEALDTRKADSDVSVANLFRSMDRTPKPLDDYQRKYRSTKDKNGLAPWIGLYHLPVSPDLLADKTRDNLMAYVKKRGTEAMLDTLKTLAYYPQDAKGRIETTMHNTKSHQYGRPDKARENLDALVQIMRKEKLDPAGFAEFLRKKFGLSHR